MRKSAVFVPYLLCAFVATAQTVKTGPVKTRGAEKPACVSGAICFSGDVSQGSEFFHVLNKDLAFKLAGGWTIAVVPIQPQSDCPEFSSVVNAPYRAHTALDIDTSYGWTAEDEVSRSPREFLFVTNCADNRTEMERLRIVLGSYTATQATYEDAMAKLGTSALGKGRLWITDSRISHAGDSSAENTGIIEWMKFSVEIVLPRQSR